MKRRIAAASRTGLRGLISLVITMVIASVALFVLMRVIPGDPASVLAGDANATQQSIAQVRHSLGLDQSMYAQYLSWLGNAVHGNLGSLVLQPGLRHLHDRHHPARHTLDRLRRPDSRRSARYSGGHPCRPPCPPARGLGRPPRRHRRQRHSGLLARRAAGRASSPSPSACSRRPVSSRRRQTPPGSSLTWSCRRRVALSIAASVDPADPQRDARSARLRLHQDAARDGHTRMEDRLAARAEERVDAGRYGAGPGHEPGDQRRRRDGAVFGIPGIGSQLASSVLQRDFPVVQGGILTLSCS